MKIAFTFLMLFMSISTFAQDKIAEFTTTHVQALGSNTKMEVKFELYQDSLVMIQLDKNIIKQYKKMGMPVSTSFVYPFEKLESPAGIYYTFRNETLDFTIAVGQKAIKPSVVMRQKDTFTNEVMEQIFISI